MYKTSQENIEKIRYELLRNTSIAEVEAMTSGESRDELVEQVLRDACGKVLDRTILSNEQARSLMTGE